MNSDDESHHEERWMIIAVGHEGEVDIVGQAPSTYPEIDTEDDDVGHASSIIFDQTPSQPNEHLIACPTVRGENEVGPILPRSGNKCSLGAPKLCPG